MYLWHILLILGCGGDDGKNGPPDTSSVTDTSTSVVTYDGSTVPLAGRCPLEDARGSVTVISTSALALVTGAVTDGVVPLTVLEEVGSAGDCVLLRQNNPFCNPACAANETCDFDGTCLPYPTEQDLGTLTIDGLSEPVEMTPNKPGFSYFFTGLDNPPHAPGDLVTLNGTGGATIDPFTLYGVGLTPLALDGEMWVVDEGVDTIVNWNPPEDGARTTVHVLITIDLHGLTPVQLECNFPDTGQGTIPGDLLDQFIDFGVTGIPSGKITRWTVDSAQQGDACFDFSVAWSENPEVDVIGFTPCHEDADCPPGQTCNEPFEICE